MPKVQPTNFVVAISSVSGGGKTTLVEKAAELLNGTVLFFDDYKTVSQYPRDMKKWVDDGADVNEWKTPRFARDIAALRNGQSITSPKDGKTVQPSEFIVIEEPMGRERAEMAPYIDFVAVIDTPLEIALSRVLLRDTTHLRLDDIDVATKEQLAKGCEQLITGLRNYLGFYLYAGRDLYIRVQEQAMATCDLVLDGQLPADELARQLVAAVEKAHEDNAGYE